MQLLSRGLYLLYTNLGATGDHVFIWIGEASTENQGGEREKKKVRVGQESPQRSREARDESTFDVYVPAAILPLDFMKCLCILISSSLFYYLFK